MASLTTPPGRIGWKAAPFELPGTDGRRHSPESARGPNGLVVMFICNHCPYVKAIVDKIVTDMRELAALGVGSIAVMSNDPTEYPEDSFENMQAEAARRAFPFPYVVDATQEVARAYDAVCTPDFFGFDAASELRYRGRLDDSGRSPKPGAKRELFEAMREIARTGMGPAIQHPSIGCSIKWKAERA